MKTMINNLKNGITFGIGFLLIVGLTQAWNGLQASDGDTLTSAKWNELVDKVASVDSSNGNLIINGTIETNASSTAIEGSNMPNNMSYGAGGSVLGGARSLNKGTYLVKYYLCAGQNSFNGGGALISTHATVGTINTTVKNYISNSTNNGTCGYFTTDILHVTSDTATVHMRVEAYNGSSSNTDNNPGGNSVSATFIKIL